MTATPGVVRSRYVVAMPTFNLSPSMHPGATRDRHGCVPALHVVVAEGPVYKNPADNDDNVTADLAGFPDGTLRLEVRRRGCTVRVRLQALSAWESERRLPGRGGRPASSAPRAEVVTPGGATSAETGRHHLAHLRAAGRVDHPPTGAVEVWPRFADDHRTATGAHACQTVWILGAKPCRLALLGATRT